MPEFRVLNAKFIGTATANSPDSVSFTLNPAMVRSGDDLHLRYLIPSPGNTDWIFTIPEEDYKRIAGSPGPLSALPTHAKRAEEGVRLPWFRPAPGVFYIRTRPSPEVQDRVFASNRFYDLRIRIVDEAPDFYLQVTSGESLVAKIIAGNIRIRI